MHNNIMAAGPNTPSTVIILAVPATENSSLIPEQTTVETVLNMSPKNKDHIESEKEAIHLILTGIGDEIYSTVDACKTAHEMWEAIERLQQEWSRFITIFKQQHKLDEVSYHKFFNILKQYQKEVNEIRADRIAKNANPLALVDTAQPYQDPYYQTSKSHKPITPPFESASEEDSDPEQAHKDKEMQKFLALIAKYFKNLYKPTNNNLRTSSNTRNKNVDTNLRYKNDNQTGQFRNQRTMTVAGARETVGNMVVKQSGIQFFNYKEFGHFAKECRKPKRVKDSMYHKEKMLLCKQAKKGVPLQAEQFDWLADTDEEIDEQELEAHYNYIAKIQEVPNADSGTDSEPLEQVQYDTRYNVFANEIQHSKQSESIRNTCVVEIVDSNVIFDSPDMCDNDIQKDRNAIECDDERVALANLIANLKLDTSRTPGESYSIRDSCLVALQNKQTEFERYKAFNDRTVDYDKLERKLNETLGLLAQKDINIKEGLKVKAYEISVVKEKHNELVKQSLLTNVTLTEGLVKNDSFAFVHEIKKEMHADLKYVESFENEIDELESDKECECLAQKLSKQTEFVSQEVYTELLRSFTKLEKHLISLEPTLQQCQEQMKNDPVCKEKASNVFQKEHEQYLEIQDLKSQLQDKNIAICKLKKLNEKCKGIFVETKFDKPSVVRKPNAQRIPKPSVFGKPAPFSDSLERKTFSKKKSDPKTNESEGMYRIDTRTTQTRAPQFSQTFRNTNPRVSTSTGVIHRTNVSRPHLRSTQIKDKVVPSNSHVKDKKTKVEDHHRTSSTSNKTKSVTASNDSFKSRTLNVNAVCATCGKCVFNSIQDRRVFINF
ncbi:hypothetical protein Tco_0059556 [Tanacetum coccineum]